MTHVAHDPIRRSIGVKLETAAHTTSLASRFPIAFVQLVILSYCSLIEKRSDSISKAERLNVCSLQELGHRLNQTVGYTRRCEQEALDSEEVVRGSVGSEDLACDVLVTGGIDRPRLEHQVSISVTQIYRQLLCILRLYYVPYFNDGRGLERPGIHKL